MTALLFLAILTTYLFARNAFLRALAREDGRVIRAQRRELECHRRTWRDVEQAMEVALQTIADAEAEAVVAEFRAEIEAWGQA